MDADETAKPRRPLTLQELVFMRMCRREAAPSRLIHYHTLDALRRFRAEYDAKRLIVAG